MIITAIEEIGWWRAPRTLARGLVPRCLRRTLALPAFLPSPARRQARAALAQAAAQLARLEPTPSPPIPDGVRPRPVRSPPSPGGADR